MYCPPAADFFRLRMLSPGEWGLTLAVVAPACGFCLLADRRRFAERRG
jgi:hypothetical protein